MKLFTHNLLTSRHLKGVKVGYPLKLHASEVKKNELEFNPDFVRRMLTRLDLEAFRTAATSVGVELPEALSKNTESTSMDTGGDGGPSGSGATAAEGSASTSSAPVPELSDETLRQVHHALMEVDIVTGTLECPETGRKFTITDGIPNMIARDDEI